MRSQCRTRTLIQGYNQHFQALGEFSIFCFLFQLSEPRMYLGIHSCNNCNYCCPLWMLCHFLKRRGKCIHSSYPLSYQQIHCWHLSWSRNMNSLTGSLHYYKTFPCCKNLLYGSWKPVMETWDIQWKEWRHKVDPT